jgi:hypothetical protein
VSFNSRKEETRTVFVKLKGVEDDKGGNEKGGSR